jgi:hypothetical protein
MDETNLIKVPKSNFFVPVADDTWAIRGTGREQNGNRRENEGDQQ